MLESEQTADETKPIDAALAELASKFAIAHGERARSDKEYKRLKAEVELAFIASATFSLTVENHVVHLSMRERIIPKEGEDQALFDALQSDKDTEFLVTRKLIGISDWVEDLPVDSKTLKPIFPEHVVDLIAVVTKTSACVRKRTKKTKGGA